MPRPIPLSIRHTIATLRKNGLSQAKIAIQTQVSLSTVKTIVKRYEAQGEAGLQTRYHCCGQTGIRSDALLARQYRAMKTWHPTFGYDKISSLMLAKYPTAALPHRRTVYRWWHRQGLMKIKDKPPGHPKAWASKPHEIWQIDAKEMMHIDSDQPHCWLNIVDEFTGGVIDPPVFSLWQDQSGTGCDN